MKVRVVGCSPAWPNPGGAQSGYLVDERVLLDCGPGVLSKLRVDGGWPEIEAIVITHWHLDHWGDLVPWVWGRMFGLPREHRPPPQLWVGPTGREQLVAFEQRMGTPDMWTRTFDLHDYEDGVPFSIGGITITASALPHYGLPTFGLRVENGDKVLAYSGDTGPSDKLVALARDADLFLCEATLVSSDADGEPRGHLSLDEAIAAYEASGAKRLLITHRPDELAAEGVELARDGLVVEL